MAGSGFKVIDHTADIGIEAWGETKTDLFVGAAAGMCSFMYDLDKVRAAKAWPIEARGYDDESLMVAWLEEVLYLFEEGRALLNQFVINELTPTSLTATVSGEEYKQEAPSVERSIKAVTYHMLNIQKNQHWHTQIIFDV